MVLVTRRGFLIAFGTACMPPGSKDQTTWQIGKSVLSISVFLSGKTAATKATTASQSWMFCFVLWFGVSIEEIKLREDVLVHRLTIEVQIHEPLVKSVLHSPNMEKLRFCLKIPLKLSKKGIVRNKIRWKHYQTADYPKWEPQVGRGLFGIRLLILHLDYVTETNTHRAICFTPYRFRGNSNLSWKYHIESICHKISKSIGNIAKIRHYVPRRVLLSVCNPLIVPYLTYGICAWENCALTFQRKIVILQKRALRLADLL